MTTEMHLSIHLKNWTMLPIMDMFTGSYYVHYVQSSYVYTYYDSYEHGFEVFSRLYAESFEMLVNHDPLEL